MRKKITQLLLVAILAASCGQKINLSAPLQADNTVVRGTLDNGFSYIIKENHLPKNQANFYFVVKAGSLVEEEHQQGLAHFLEHMAFYGSKYFSGTSVSSYFESVGATFGADTNAYTSFNETVYTLSLPIDNHDTIIETFKIMKGWAEGLYLYDDDINRERGAVLEELRSGLSASRRIFNAQWPTLLNGSRYAKRLPIGKEEVIRTANHQRFKEFYDKWYQSQFQSVIIVGDFDKTIMEQHVKSTFGSLTQGDSKLPKVPFTPPEYDVFQVDTDPELTQNNLSIYYPRVEERPYQTVGDFKTLLTDMLINQIINNRLNRLTLNPSSSLISAGAGSMTIGKSQQYFALFANHKEGQALEAYEQLVMLSQQAKKFGFTAKELALAKADLLSSLEVSANETDHKSSNNLTRQYLTALLADDVITSASYELALAKKVYPSITLNEINLKFARYTSGKAITLLSAPTSEGNVPSSNQLKNFADQIDLTQVTAYIDQAISEEELYATPKNKGKVVKVEKLSQGITKWYLSNGIELFIKETPYKKDEILFYAWAPGGYHLASDSALASAKIALPLVDESGLGPWNSVELEQKLTGINMSLSPFFKNYSKGFAGNSSNKDLESLFKMLYLYSNEKPQDEEAFSRLKTRYIQSFTGRMGSPDEAFGLAIYRSLYGNDNPRYQYPTLSFYQNINLEEASTFYSNQINQEALSAMRYFFVGSVDEKTLKPLVERYLASLPSHQPTDSQLNISPTPSPLQEPVIVYNGLESQARLYINYTLNRPQNPQDAIYWSALERLAQMRLFDAVRGEIGATYSPGVAINREELSDRVNLSVVLTLDPTRVDEVRLLVDREIAAILTSGLNDDYYQKAEKTLQESEKNNRQKNSYWLSLMTSFDERSIDFESITEREYYLDHVNRIEMEGFLAELYQNKIKSEAIRLPNQLK